MGGIDVFNQVEESARYILSKINIKPKLAVILGSGLSNITDCIKDRKEISYKDIPYFKDSNVVGHEYKLIFGKLGNTSVVMMAGRFHYYEGYSMKDLTFPIYVLKAIGVESLIVTNACGGINENFKPGDLMLIKDHINITGLNPLIGENDERFGLRFPDMSEPYSISKINYAKNIAFNLNIDLKEGTYFYYTGPSYETKAEIIAFKTLGADVCGMSTVPEVIVANYLGMEVLGISCITNMATGISKTKHTHEEVLEVAAKSSRNLVRLVEELIKNW